MKINFAVAYQPVALQSPEAGEEVLKGQLLAPFAIVRTEIVPVETELKLQIAPAATDMLLKSGVLAQDVAAKRQYSIYFDEPKFGLRQAGLSLRIRRTDSKRVQTVKANGHAAGMFARSEWEQDVESDVPNLDDSTPIPALTSFRVEQLSPVFAIENERRTWDIIQGNSTIEVALDQGRAIAADRQASICEIELELKDGAVADLFRLAAQLSDVTPLRLGVLSKSDRGYRLLGPLLTSARAEPSNLLREMTAAEAFQAIIAACIKHYRLNEDRLVDYRDTEALHQARVALRRLRSALNVFEPFLRDPIAAGLEDEIKWLARLLGAARDIDVLIKRTESEDLRSELRARRDGAYEDVERAIRSDRGRRLMLDLVEWSTTGAWLDAPALQETRKLPVAAFADEALDRLRKKVKRRGSALDELDDKSRHQVRKNAKKLRYATEFFAPLFASKRQQRQRRKFVSAVECLQDSLGTLNDLVSAPSQLEHLHVGPEANAAKTVSSRKKSKLLKTAMSAHDDFINVQKFWRA